jgi:4-hydroxybenzoate polyprenyltransferase
VTIRTLLDLGRVSNLPTVWTNVLAGAVLSGGRLEPWPLAGLAVAGSLFYVGGMFLNDAFDRDFDSRVRSDRPIPSGRATAGQVFAIGFALLASGVILVGVLSRLRGPSLDIGSSGWSPVASASALGSLIVLYDAFHKGNPLSVVVMGLCRAGLYALAAASLGRFNSAVVAGAFVLFAYVVGLSGVARQETRTAVRSLAPLALLAVPFAYAVLLGLTTDALLIGAARGAAIGVGALFLAWCVYSLSFLHRSRGPRIPRAVTGLIAGICLVDALVIALHGDPAWAVVAALGLPFTVLAQRQVAGT